MARKPAECPQFCQDKFKNSPSVRRKLSTLLISTGNFLEIQINLGLFALFFPYLPEKCLLSKSLGRFFKLILSGQVLKLFCQIANYSFQIQSFHNFFSASMPSLKKTNLSTKLFLLLKQLLLFFCQITKCSFELLSFNKFQLRRLKKLIFLSNHHGKSTEQ